MTRAQDTAEASWLRRDWWTRYFTGDLSHFWPPELDQLPPAPEGDDYLSITRDDVFAIATTDSDHRELHTAVAAYVWGVGKSVFLLGRLVRAFTNDPDAVEPALVRAASVLFADGAASAYATMLPGQPNYVKFMGPAYFTKFLFFMGYRGRCPGPPPLILDKRVATALRARQAMNIPDAGWPAKTYKAYLSYCQDRNRTNPESVEIELFNTGRSS